MIVKVQIPIVSTKENPPAFIYNEDRSYVAKAEITDELMEVFGNQEKLFFNATITNGSLLLIENVSDPGW